MIRLGVVLVSLAVVGFAPAPLPRKERKQKVDDLTLLQGKWKLIEFRNQGVRENRNNEGARVKGKTWFFLFGAVNHGAELVHPKEAAPLAHPPLAEEDRTGGIEFNQQSQAKHQGREKDQ